jgi:hypothetical protein
MSQKYPGGFITKSPVAPTSSAASGMWTLDQAMQLKKQGNWPPMAAGTAFGGGFFAGQISTAGNGIADYNLVVGPASSAQSTGQFKTANTTTAGTSSVIDGPANSAAMNNASHPCAQFCEGLTIGGYSDWYLPAINELDVCYAGLKPTTATNSPGTGINPNSVPARPTGYTSNNPGQTAASSFQTGNSEAYINQFYWSSTQSESPNDATNAYILAFGQGGVRNNYGSKTRVGYFRAVRRVAV